MIGGKFLLILIVAMMGFAGVQSYRLAQEHAAHAQTKVVLANERGAHAAAVAEAQDKARTREGELQAAADKVKQEKAREISRLNRLHADALERLRSRPERPADSAGAVPTSAGSGEAGAGCTGGQLYREDAEFLLGEALRADHIRLQLAACQAAYSAARGLTGP